MPAARWLRPLVVGCAGALLVSVLVARQGEVLARGNLLPVFEAYEVTQVRVLGVKLFVDHSTDAGDVVTSVALVLAGTVLLYAARRVTRPRRGVFATAGWGSLFLAADDLLGAHETLGHNLATFGRIPVVDHPDDAVIAVYAAVVAFFAWRHRNLVRGTPWRPWCVATVSAALAVAHDVSPLHLRALEEALEVLAGGAALVAVIALARHHVREAEVQVPAR